MEADLMRDGFPQKHRQFGLQDFWDWIGVRVRRAQAQAED
jgi:hypothetical protein